MMIRSTTYLTSLLAIVALVACAAPAGAPQSTPVSEHEPLGGQAEDQAAAPSLPIVSQRETDELELMPVNMTAPTTAPQPEATATPTPPASVQAAATPQPTPQPVQQVASSTGGVPDELLAAILADASERTGIPSDQIAVLQADAVTWNDGSLGCPQPGMMYTQALVDGYHVVLQAGSAELDYRADARGHFQLCGY